MNGMILDSGLFQSVAPAAYKTAMRKLVAGVSLITVSGRGGRNGLTATAVCSVAADPPTLLCCVNRSASAFSDLRAAGVFAVNLLQRHHRGLAYRFAAEPSGESRFDTGQWVAGTTGAPVLADALASFECEVSEIVPASTHGIFIGRVVAVDHRTGNELLYSGGVYGTLSLIYKPLRNEDDPLAG
jgi:cob(II)yrinic acid a,c-diamide reductase